MAAFDTPLITSLLSPPRTTAPDSNASGHPRPTMPKKDKDANSTIIAQFSPGQQPMGTAPVIPDPTTNLLESTPPQIVRALAQAEPLIRGFNILLGLLTWTSGQDWLSFFLLVAWWISCLYGGIIIKFAGNLLPVVAVGLWYTHHRAVGEKVERTATHTSLSSTLKEIDVLRTRITLFLTPPSLLLPHLAFPASQQLLMRLCLAWPIWLLLTHKILPPRKIVMIFGTAVLCWSAPWARVICIALWRSRTVRGLCGHIIGQDLLADDKGEKTVVPQQQPTTTSRKSAELKPAELQGHEKKASTSSIRDVLAGGIKITQTLYQHQRRWITIGWTNNLLPTERSAWTDETEHPAMPKDQFTLPPDKSIPHTLPTGENALRVARWRWVDADWKQVIKPNETDAEGWIYTDNAWKNPGPTEAFGKYTRRRKFVRRSELTEEIIPVEENGHNKDIETSSQRVSTSTPRMDTSTPKITDRQLEPTNSMKIGSPLTRLESPTAVRPPGSIDLRGSIGSDVRDAMGIGLDFKDEKESEMAEKKKEERQIPPLGNDFGNGS